MPKAKKSGAKVAAKARRAASKTKRAVPRARQTKPIELYYWPTPNGWKISIMLEECGLPYTLIPVNISRGDQFKPEFLKISPNNRMPAITRNFGLDRDFAAFAFLDLAMKQHPSRPRQI